MESNEHKKELIEQQFQELFDKAKELYPNIDEAVATINNITAQTTNLQDYLNLTMQTPTETSNNQITIA
ncbi:MAG: hypothetical protein EBS07_09275 [Sphingobacteriia bacterium]|nr:hypothetical protein [Sphingobacteriia bacterium]